ncbi:MAG: flagellar motor protein MotB [Gammaproteobacteria bacterium]
MADDKKQPIVIKKINKGGHAHHGGSWKVAYADFVTAMMAFFLLLWLLGSTSEGQKAGISDYFKNPSGVQGPGGASTSMIKLGGTLEIPKGDDSKKKDQRQTQATPTEQDIKAQAREIVREVEKKRLDALLQVLKEAIEKSQALKPFKDQLLLDITPEGLRIQIVDKENRPMFGLASATLKPYMQGILREITKIIDTVPNRISISGHTDVTSFVKGYYREYEETGERFSYTNWELSADRANAARREMVKHGLAPDKIGRVIGLSSSVLFDKQNPRNPINRRISIIVMNKATEESLGLGERPEATVTDVESLMQINADSPATVEELQLLLPGTQMRVR